MKQKSLNLQVMGVRGSIDPRTAHFSFNHYNKVVDAGIYIIGNHYIPIGKDIAKQGYPTGDLVYEDYYDKADIINAHKTNRALPTSELATKFKNYLGLNYTYFTNKIEYNGILVIHATNINNDDNSVVVQIFMRNPDKAIYYRMYDEFNNSWSNWVALVTDISDTIVRFNDGKSLLVRMEDLETLYKLSNVSSGNYTSTNRSGLYRENNAVNKLKQKAVSGIDPIINNLTINNINNDNIIVSKNGIVPIHYENKILAYRIYGKDIPDLKPLLSQRFDYNGTYYWANDRMTFESNGYTFDQSGSTKIKPWDNNYYREINEDIVKPGIVVFPSEDSLILGKESKKAQVITTLGREDVYKEPARSTLAELFDLGSRSTYAIYGLPDVCDLFFIPKRIEDIKIKASTGGLGLENLTNYHQGRHHSIQRQGRTIKAESLGMDYRSFIVNHIKTPFMNYPVDNLTPVRPTNLGDRINMIKNYSNVGFNNSDRFYTNYNKNDVTISNDREGNVIITDWFKTVNFRNLYKIYILPVGGV